MTSPTGPLTRSPNSGSSAHRIETGRPRRWIGESEGEPDDHIDGPGVDAPVDEGLGERHVRPHLLAVPPTPGLTWVVAKLNGSATP